MVVLSEQHYYDLVKQNCMYKNKLLTDYFVKLLQQNFKKFCAQLV